MHSSLAQSAAVGLTLWCAGWLGGHVDGLLIDQHGLVWAPAGVCLAAVLWRGTAVVPGLVVGAIALAPSCVDSLSHGLCAFAGKFGTVVMAPLVPCLILARVELRPSLARLTDVLNLSLIGGLGTGLCVSTWQALVCLVITGMPMSGTEWAARAMAAALGVLLVAPLLLVWGHALHVGSTHWLEMIEVGALCACATVVATSLWRPTGPVLGIGTTGIPLMVLPALLWASTRFGQRGAVTSLSALGLWAVAHGRSLGQPDLHLASSASVLSAQLSLGAAALSVLVFGAMIEERRQAIRVRDDFLIIASHELKTPLTALMLGVENLERRLHKEADPTNLLHIRKLGMCHQQVNRLARLVDGLLDVSRISNRRLSLHRQPADLAGIVRVAVNEAQPQAQILHCSLAASLSEGTWGQWDCERMGQLVHALIDNACKYGAGSPVQVTLCATSDVVHLEVVDHGIGIAAKDARRIFGRFERAVSAQYYGGMGLGLYVVRKIARAHGGEVWVYSRPGKGSIFTVELPRQQSLAARVMGLRPLRHAWMASKPQGFH